MYLHLISQTWLLPEQVQAWQDPWQQACLCNRANIILSWPMGIGGLQMAIINWYIMVVHIAPKIIRLVAVKRDQGRRCEVLGSFTASSSGQNSWCLWPWKVYLIRRCFSSPGAGSQTPGRQLFWPSHNTNRLSSTWKRFSFRMFHMHTFAYLALERPKNGNIFKLRRRRGRRIPTRKALEKYQSNDLFEYYSHPMKPSSRVF